MKRNVIIINLYLLGLMFVSCSQDKELLQASAEDQQPMFKLEISSDKLKSEAQDELKTIHFSTNHSDTLGISAIEPTVWEVEPINPTKTNWVFTSYNVTWNVGDAIGIYKRRSSGTVDVAIDRNNKKYETTTGNTNSVTFYSSVPPALKYTTATGDNNNFYAYYPYNTFPDNNLSLVKFANSAAESSTTLNYTIPANQTAMETLANTDLMFASARNVNNTVTPIGLNFQHALSLVTFRIKSSHLNGMTLTKVSLSGSKVTSGGTLDLTATSPAVNTTGSTPFVPYSIVNKSVNNTTNTEVELIINPCTVNGTTGQMMVTLTFGDQNYTIAMPSYTFVAGQRSYFYVSTGSIKSNNIYVSSSIGGQVQIGETILQNEATTTYNPLSFTPLNATVTGLPGWTPYRVVIDGVATDLPATSPQTYSFTPFNVANTVRFIFKPSTWYPTNGLIIHYDGIFSGGFNNTLTNVSTNNTWKDLTWNSYNGSLINCNYNSNSGWIASAFKFDGTNDYVRFNGIMSPNFTMNFVLNFSGSTSQNTDARLIGEGTTYPTFLLLGSSALASGSRPIAVNASPSPIAFPSNYSPPRNTKLQLTMSFNNTTKEMRLYVNGVYSSSITLPTTTFATAGYLVSLGATNSGTKLIKGDYYNFMLYNRTLSDAEVTSIYNLNRTRFTMP